MAQSTERRGRLAVVYQHHSVSAFDAAEAARGAYDLIWVLDAGDEQLGALVPLLRRFGSLVDTSGLDDEAVAEAVAAEEPDGIVTFADEMVRTAVIAHRLGLVFHSLAAAELLSDKYLQRQALAAAGVPGPSFWPIPSDLDDEGARELAGRLDYPAVVKPRDSMGSRHTYRIENPAEMVAILTEVGDHPGGMLAEEVLVEAHPRSEQKFGDVLMVESVLRDGGFTHLTVTGHFVPADPYRGSGSFVPSHLDPPVVDAVLSATEAAAVALGLRDGIINTDLILTPQGPRVLEVNGRLGGQIPQLFKIAGAPSALRLAMDLAMGKAAAEVQPLRTDCVAYCYMYQPPMDAHSLVRIEGLDELRKLAGVTAVVAHAQAGDVIDWRHGTNSYLFAVYGAVAGHEDLHRTRLAIDVTVHVVYDSEPA